MLGVVFDFRIIGVMGGALMGREVTVGHDALVLAARRQFVNVLWGESRRERKKRRHQ